MQLFAALLLGTCLQGGPAALPAIAIIIDDLGNQPHSDRAALNLPGSLTYAILPFSPLAGELARAVRRSGREVLLHLPMEADSHNHLLGPGALRESMSHGEFVAAIHRALTAVPYLTGVNNHMGSRLTRDRERMDWLMAELRAVGGLLYVDSRTTADSAAPAAAAAARLPYAVRDVFLDNRQHAAYIERQFEALLAHAARHGDAIGIAHPRSVTLAVLRRRLAALSGVRLVALAELMQRRACRRPAVSVAPAVAARAERDGESEYAEHAE